MHFLYLFAIITISAADELEIVTTVNCTIGGPISETISGINDTKWQFMRNSCPSTASLHINFTEVKLCNQLGQATKHAILVIEKKKTPSTGGQHQRISSASTKVDAVNLLKYPQVDLYSTIHSTAMKADCNFIVKFTYFFASDAETTTPPKPNDETQSPCSTVETVSILLGISFGVTLLLGLICTVIKYRKQKALLQGESTSKHPPVSEKEGNDVAETRVNEIYSME